MELESLVSQAMWLEVEQVGGMETENLSSKGALRERPTLGKVGEQSWQPAAILL